MSEGKKSKRTKSVGGKVVVAPAFDRLKNMKCFGEAHQRLIEGWPLNDLARWIQETKEECTDISQEALATTLSKYRSSIPLGEIKATEELPSFLAKKMDEAEQTIDELQALKDIFDIQKARIDMDHKLEKQVGKSFGSLGQEIRIMREIIAESLKTKMELGIKKRDLGTLNVGGEVSVAHAHTHQEIDNPAVKKLLDSPQSRRKLLGIARTLLKSAGTTLSSADLMPEMVDDVIEGELGSEDLGESVAE